MIIMNSGKNINDLGDIDGCNAVPSLHYATLRVSGIGIAAYIGLCIPKECGKEDMSLVTEAMNKMLGQSNIKVISSFPALDTPDVTTGNVLGFIFFFSFALFCIFAIYVEHSDLFKTDDNDPKDTTFRKV